MGLFNKLFGNESESQSESSSQPKVKKSLQDFFIVKLEEIPNDNFVEGQTELNSQGETVIHYRANLNYLEAGIFDAIEILKFPATNTKTVWFQSFNLSHVNINKVKDFVNSLYLIKVVDDLKNGKFNSEDEKHFYSREFDVLFSRMWGGESPCMLDISRDENRIQFTIHNIN
jgi:hypothetical protein